jgi:hypothetical protein
MHPSSAQSKLVGHLVHPTRNALFAALSVVRLFPRSFDRRRKSSMESLAEDEAMLLDAHGSMRASNPGRCWRVLNEWLNSRGDEADDYAWIASKIGAWGDSNYVDRLYQERVSRLLAVKRTDEALDVTVRRLSVDPRFRPKSSADTLKLAQLGAQGGRLPRLSRLLLVNFAARFKGDPRVPVAEALMRHLNAMTSTPPQQKSA